MQSSSRNGSNSFVSDDHPVNYYSIMHLFHKYIRVTEMMLSNF